MAKQFTKCLGITITTLGLLQATLWEVICAIFICIHYDVIEVTPKSGSITSEFIHLFLDKNSPLNSVLVNTHLDSNRFVVFLWGYVALSLVWILASILVIYEMNRRKWSLTAGVSTSCILWAITVFFNSSFDVILFVFLMVDYEYLRVTFQDISQETLWCFKIVIILSLRGITLWILNVITSLWSIIYTLKTNKKESVVDDKREIIKAHEESPNGWEFMNQNSPGPSQNNILPSNRSDFASTAFVDNNQQKYKSPSSRLGKMIGPQGVYYN